MKNNEKLNKRLIIIYLSITVVFLTCMGIKWLEASRFTKADMETAIEWYLYDDMAYVSHVKCKSNLTGSKISATADVLAYDYSIVYLDEREVDGIAYIEIENDIITLFTIDGTTYKRGDYIRGGGD